MFELVLLVVLLPIEANKIVYMYMFIRIGPSLETHCLVHWINPIRSRPRRVTAAATPTRHLPASLFTDTPQSSLLRKKVKCQIELNRSQFFHRDPYVGYGKYVCRSCLRARRSADR